MTEPRLRIGQSSWVVLGLVLRLVVIAALVLGGYFLAPLGREMKASAWVVIVIGLLLIGVLVVYLGRAIARSPHPVLRGAESLVMSALLFLVLFASLYYTLEQSTPSSFNAPLTKLDALYFTVTVFATVGFGDIVPLTQTARGMVMLQMVVDLVFIGVAIKVLTAVTRRALAHRRGEPT